MKNTKVLLTLIIVLSSISFLYSQTLQDLLNTGDKLTEEFQHKKALEVYQKADSLFPNNWEVNWRISRALVDIGVKMPSESGDQEDAQLAVFEKALKYADKSIKLAPTEAIPYVRRAVANGRIALFKGVFSVSSVVNAVKDDCEKAIALGNGGNYTQALAHYILGRTNAKVSEKWAPARAVLGLGWADLDTAIVEYKKAINLYPNFRMFYLGLAKAYIENDEYSKARENLNKVIASPEKDQDDKANLKEAKKLLEDIKDE